MRLIGNVPTEKEAFVFYAFLLKQGVTSLYEPYTEGVEKLTQYRLWVYDEEDVQKTLEWFEFYKQHPHDAQFQEGAAPPKPLPASPDYQEISEKETLKWSSPPAAKHKVKRAPFFLGRLIVLLCILLFLWNDKEDSELVEAKGAIVVQLAMTPLQQDMLFDVPSAYQYIAELVDTVPLQGVEDLKQLPPEAIALLHQAEQAPAWHGIFPFLKQVGEKGWESAAAVPMFEKIQQGEFWRLFTPCLMHRDFLHILFNMIWAWLLLKQLEARMNRFKILALIVVIGIVSNIAQYLMGGPFFLGFSGVIVGLAAFIWVRQKRAPWEGYTLPKATVMFLFFFVLAMFAIEVFSLLLQWFASIYVMPYIANTAHIVGGLMGLLLGRLSFFGRRQS